jgi:hypothetical protein
MHRTDGALIRLMTPVAGDGDAAAEARLGALLATIIPQIKTYIPGPSGN